MKYIRNLQALLVFEMAGCASPAPVVQAPPAPLSSSSASAAPSASTVTAPPLAKPEPAPVQSPLHIVATGASLFPTPRGLMLYDGEAMLADVHGDTFTPHPDYLGTYAPEAFSSMEVLPTQWPEHGIISVNRANGRTGYATAYEKNGKGWRQLSRTDLSEWYTGVQPWNHGRTLAFVSSMTFGYHWEVLLGPRGVLPQPRLIPPSAEGYPYAIPQVIPVAFATLKSGELFAAGTDNTKDKTNAVERWAPDSKKGVIDELPSPGEAAAEVLGVALISPNDAYVYGAVHARRDATSFEPKDTGAYLVHFDGKTWTPLDFPGGDGILSLAVSGTSVWASTRSEVYTRALGSTRWDSVPLPGEAQLRAAGLKTGPLSIKQVYADPENVLWIGVEVQGQKVVLRNKPAASIWQSPAGAAWQHSVEKFQPLRPANAGCQWIGLPIFVMLYAATPTTPKDYDYPLTRAALKGHTEFQNVVFAETEEAGRHYFGAFVPDLDLELANKLVAVVQKGVKGSKPVALCRNPKQLRILGIDLKTGNVTSNAAAPAEDN